MQRTTEKTGEHIPDDPAELIDPGEHGQPCLLMVVEVDGTTSPQISSRPGVTGGNGLRAQTCFKEFNLVVIEKRDGTKIIDRWTGARYGPRKDSEPYAAQAGMQMGLRGRRANAVHRRRSAPQLGACDDALSWGGADFWITTMRLSIWLSSATCCRHRIAISMP